MSPRSRCAAPAHSSRGWTARVPATGRGSLEDVSFDAVWAGEVIEHVVDTAAWLSEVRRVLRSGGRWC